MKMLKLYFFLCLVMLEKTNIIHIDTTHSVDTLETK